MLKKIEINLPLPYNIIEEEGSYFFKTEQGLVYDCRYKNVLPYLSPILGIYDFEIFDFEFQYLDTAPTIKKYGDDRIAVTIKSLLFGFFSNPLRVLIFVCDSSDKKERSRQFLFRYWFREFAEEFNRTAIDINIDDITVYGCILSRNNIPNADVLTRELIDKAEEIMIEKYGG